MAKSPRSLKEKEKDAFLAKGWREDCLCYVKKCDGIFSNGEEIKIIKMYMYKEEKFWLICKKGEDIPNSKIWWKSLYQ